jgi:Fe-S oxidoreductase
MTDSDKRARADGRSSGGRAAADASRRRDATTADALAFCIYCPSLCRHACPVATAEGSDTTSPWGLMSLAAHSRARRVEPSDDVVATLAACTGCGACTAACLHAVDVAHTLVDVRADLVAAGAAPVPFATRRGGDDAAATEAFFDGLHARSRYEDRPQVSLVPGLSSTSKAHADESVNAVHAFFGVCERLDLDGIACGELARLDLGYDLWFTGRHDAFLDVARRAHAAANGAREIVVLSAEALHLLKDIYPRFGLSFGAAILHVSELLAPVLSGAVVRRLPGRIGYHESCHLGRGQKLRELPRQVLKRVIEGPLHELPARAEITGCCGGSGLSCTRPETSDAMADTVLGAAAELGWDRLVTFSLECASAFRRARVRRVERGLEPGPRIDFGVALVAEAVIGDGAAA